MKALEPLHLRTAGVMEACQHFFQLRLLYDAVHISIGLIQRKIFISTLEELQL